MHADWLRILLQGHAKIEELLDQGLTDEFHGEMPRDIKSLNFPRRVAVARGLRILRDGTKSKMLTLADVRHRIAHHREGEVELTPEQVNQLRQVVGDAMPNISSMPPSEVLRAAIALTWGSVLVDVEFAKYRRGYTEQAVAAFRANQQSRQRTEALIAQLRADAADQSESA